MLCCVKMTISHDAQVTTFNLFKPNPESTLSYVDCEANSYMYNLNALKNEVNSNGRW